jgi:hypothetical protein
MIETAALGAFQIQSFDGRRDEHFRGDSKRGELGSTESNVLRD